MPTRRSSYAAAASRIGVTIATYETNRAQGRRWCVRCRCWHPEESFGLDTTRERRRVCKIGPWRVDA